MVDLDAIFRAYLLGPPARMTVAGAPGYSGPSIASLVGERVFAGVDLPPGYNPDPEVEVVDEGDERGSAILFRVGAGPSSSAPLLYPTVQIRSYAMNEALARQIDQAVFDHMQGAQTRDIKALWLTVIGQLSRDNEPRPTWPYVLSSYGAITRAY